MTISRETAALRTDIKTREIELESAKKRLIVAEANDAEGTLHGAELLLSIASVMENAGQHITLASKRREAIAWACRIAAARIPELVKVAEESHT